MAYNPAPVQAKRAKIVAAAAAFDGSQHASVLHIGADGSQTWIDFAVRNATLTSANSIYENQVIGIYIDAPPLTNGYIITIPGIYDPLAIGVMGEYAHTWTSLQPSGNIDVDSGRGGVYATWFNRGIYLNGAIYGGHNVYSSSRSSLGGVASGGTGGGEFSTFISGGYDFHLGNLTLGPIGSLQYTYVNIDSFSEKGSLAPLQFPSQSADSLRTDFGLRAFYVWQIGKIMVEPSLRAAWEHEFKYSALPITAGFDGIAGPSATFFGPSEGHDSAIVSAGVSVRWTPTIATYVNYDGQLGRDRYDSNAVTGGVRISF